MSQIHSKLRAPILARMVEKAPGQKLGRTQVMKLFYFLQELKGVPLGYDFRLFTYGPFDSDVLGDLGTACSLKVVEEKTAIYAQGYGYDITPGANAAKHSQKLESELEAHVDSVVGEFGSLSAAELELRSTVLFVDRDLKRAESTTDAAELAEKVHQIKPHFAVATIRIRIGEMANKGFLESVTGVPA